MSKYFGNEQLPVFDGYSRTESDKRYLAPVFMVYWWPNRATIPAGYVAADGQLLNRKTFPHVITGIQDGIVPVIDDETWLNDPTKRGCYTLGDGSTNFRIPDYNGKSAGSLGAVFLRGDGERSAGVSGEIQEDAIRNITGDVSQLLAINNTFSDADATGAFTATVIGGASSNISGGSSGDKIFSFGFEASRVVPTADENRPLNVTGCWIIKLFGEVVNVGSADAEQLASDYANLAGRVATLESRPSLGWDQTWQDMTSQRATGVNYTNTTGRTIFVAAGDDISFTTSNLELVVDGEKISGFVVGGGSGISKNTTVSGLVPPGSIYRINRLGDGKEITWWKELR